MNEFSARLTHVRERIGAAIDRAGRRSGSVRLVAVSKTFSSQAVVEAVRAGLEIFGENRVQEAASKIPEVATLLGSADQSLSPSSGSRMGNRPLPERGGPAGPLWHLIGHLQSNKARQATALFDLIHTVDDRELARKLDAAAKASGKRQAVLIQVNVAGEIAKSGVGPPGLRGLVEAVVACPNLELRGLMTIPPYDPDPKISRPHFRALWELGERLAGWLAPHPYPGELSMGMSEDLEVAIEEGATLVRVGRALFGDRPV